MYPASVPCLLTICFQQLVLPQAISVGNCHDCHLGLYFFSFSFFGFSGDHVLVSFSPTQLEKKKQTSKW